MSMCQPMNNGMKSDATAPAAYSCAHFALWLGTAVLAVSIFLILTRIGGFGLRLAVILPVLLIIHLVLAVIILPPTQAKPNSLPQ